MNLETAAELLRMSTQLMLMIQQTIMTTWPNEEAAKVAIATARQETDEGYQKLVESWGEEPSLPGL